MAKGANRTTPSLLSEIAPDPALDALTVPVAADPAARTERRASRAVRLPAPPPDPAIGGAGGEPTRVDDRTHRMPAAEALAAG